MGIKRKIQKDIRQRKIEVVFTNERLITPSGLFIVGGLLRKSELVRLANRLPVKQKRSEPQIKNGDILLSYIGRNWSVAPRFPFKNFRKMTIYR